MYLTIVTILGSGCIIASLLEEFQKPAWRTFRASLFAGALEQGGVAAQLAPCALCMPRLLTSEHELLAPRLPHPHACVRMS